MISKPPRPGSLGDRTSIPPPASCSPFSGKSSSNTINESLPVGSGVGSDSTVTGAKAVVLVEVHPVTKTLQAGGIGAPPMVWPQPRSPGFAPVVGEQSGGVTVAGKGAPASPGKTE